MRLLAKGTALAMLMALMLVCVTGVPALASHGGIGYVNLYTDGGTDEVGSNWAFYVETPAAVGLDASYWNLTVYAVPLNASATNATYYVHVHIYDGSTNLTKNVTLACKNDKTIYANVSHNSAAIAGMKENMSAVLYVELIKASSGTIDHYDGTISIYTQQAYANIANLVGVMVGLVVFIGVMKMMFGVMPGKGRKKE